MQKAQELKQILKRLNAGEDPETVRGEAKELLETIGPADLSIAEQELIDEGLSIEDIEHLCPIHLEVMSDQVAKMREDLPKGHIVSTMVSEHDMILGFLDMLQEINGSIQAIPEYPGRTEEFQKLAHIAEHLVETEKHHQREEDVLFPELEKRGVHGPPAVMREEHNQLRPRKHALKELADHAGEGDFAAFKRGLDELVLFIVPTLRDHIFKENNILYPTALQVVEDQSIWQKLKHECDEIGYCCFTPEQ